MLREFLLATQFLTIVRVAVDIPFDERSFGRSAVFFPLVGLFVGGIGWGSDVLLQTVCPSSLCSVMIIGLLAVLSRGLHLDGLADSADGLFAGVDRQRSLAIMKDSRIGTFGTLAVVFILFLKVRALDVLVGEERMAALLLGPMLSRWAYVMLAYRARPARPDGLGAMFMRNVFFRESAITSSFTFLAAAVLGGMAGVFCFVLMGGVLYGLLRYCTARLGGMTGDTLGATGEIIETLTLTWFALSR